jgi:hypothetical protein
VAFWNREKREEKRAREGQAQEEIDRVQEISKGMLDGFGSSMRVNPGVLLIPIREGRTRGESRLLWTRNSPLGFRQDR